MSSDEMNKTIARAFYADGATGERDDELIAANIVYHGPPMIGEVHGRDGFKRVLGVFRTAFPGFETAIEDMVADGNRVAVRHTHHATQTWEFPGVAPTGKRVSVPGIENRRIQNGQVAEFWHCDDFLSLLQQLGAIPTPEKSAS